MVRMNPSLGILSRSPCEVEAGSLLRLEGFSSRSITCLSDKTYRHLDLRIILDKVCRG